MKEDFDIGDFVQWKCHHYCEWTRGLIINMGYGFIDPERTDKGRAFLYTIKVLGSEAVIEEIPAEELEHV